MTKPVTRQYTTLRLAGSWDDIGRQLARNFPSEIMQSRNLFLLIFGITTRDFQKYYQKIETHIPENIKIQMEAMADELAKVKNVSLQKARDAVLAWNIGYDIMQMQIDARTSGRKMVLQDDSPETGACAAFAFLTPDELIMTHITDAPPQAEGGTLIEYVPNTGEKRYLSFFAPGNAGVGLGINEDKLCITYNVGRPNRGAVAGVPGTMIAREVLTNCSTVEEAIEMFTRHLENGGTYAHQGIRFLIGNFNQKKAVDIQVRSTEIKVSPPQPLKDGTSYIAFTNHFSDDFAQLNDVELNETPNISSINRLARLEQLISETEEFNVERCFEIATDHDGLEEGNNDTLCRHGSGFTSVIVNVFLKDSVQYTVGQTCKYLAQYGEPKVVDLENPIIPAVQVKVENEHGEALPFKKLHLYSFDVPGTADTLATDENGVAVFNNLYPGIYYIYYDKSDRKNKKKAVPVDYDGENIAEITLVPADDPAQKRNFKIIEKDQKRHKLFGLEVDGILKKIDFQYLFIAIFLGAAFSAANTVLLSPYLKEVIGVPSNNLGTISTILTNIGQLAILLFAGYIGALSDRQGKKKVISVGFLLLLISNLAYIFAPSAFTVLLPLAGILALVFLTRAVSSVGYQMSTSSLMALTADYCTPKDKGTGMTVYSMVNGIGMLVANGVYSGIVFALGILAGFWLSVVISLAGLIIAVFLLRNNGKVSEQARKTRFKDIIPLVKRSRGLKAGYLASLLTRTDIIIITAMLVIWATKLAGDYNVPVENVPLRVVGPIIISSLVTLIAFPVIGISMDRIGKVRTLKFSSWISIAGFIAMLPVKNPFNPIIVLPAILISIGFAGQALGSNAIVSQIAPKSKTGSLIGGLNAMQPIGMILFMAVGGILLDLVGMWAVILFKLLMNLVLIAYLQVNQKELAVEV